MTKQARTQSLTGALAQTDLVEDAELLSQLRGDLFSSGVGFTVHRLFNTCSRK